MKAFLRRKLTNIIAGAMAPILSQHRANLQSDIRRLIKDTTLFEELKASITTADFIQKSMGGVKDYPDKQTLLVASLGLTTNSPESLVLEFGVWRGDSIRNIAEVTKSKVFGFDSFEGLPESWRPGYPEGFFAMNQLPDVPANVTLIKGWFNETLPPFLSKSQGAIAFVHIDCDLYSSTKTILNLCESKLTKGSIILFDEYFNHARWETGEYLAFKEWIALTGRSFDYVGYCSTDEQVAVRLN